MNSFELQIFNDFIELRPMSEWLHHVAECLVLPEPLVKDLDLCANEAVANIILYAYEDQDQHQIQMRIELKKNQELCLTIQDDGKPFDPFKAVLPDSYDKIGDVNIGGLGIKLMRSLVDQCHYQWLNGKNILSLCFLQRSVHMIHSENSTNFHFCNN